MTKHDAIVMHFTMDATHEGLTAYVNVELTVVNPLTGGFVWFIKPSVVKNPRPHFSSMKSTDEARKLCKELLVVSKLAYAKAVLEALKLHDSPVLYRLCTQDPTLASLGIPTSVDAWSPTRVKQLCQEVLDGASQLQKGSET